MPLERRKDARWHVTLSIGNEIWNHLLRSALPIPIADGRFDLVANARQAVSYLELRQRVRGFIEASHPPDVLIRVRDRARAAVVERQELIEQLAQQLVHVEGTWSVQVDQEGSSFYTGEQRVGVEAWLHGRAEGLASLLWKRYDLPFKLEHRAGAVLHLKDIHYDAERRSVVGDLGDLTVDFGEHLLLQLLSQVAQVLLEKQLQKVNPLEVLKQDQVAQLASPLGGPFKVEMGVENLELEVSEDNVSLKVRFGFTQKQIELGA